MRICHLPSMRSTSSAPCPVVTVSALVLLLHFPCHKCRALPAGGDNMPVRRHVDTDGRVSSLTVPKEGLEVVVPCDRHQEASDGMSTEELGCTLQGAAAADAELDALAIRPVPIHGDFGVLFEPAPPLEALLYNERVRSALRRAWRNAGGLLVLRGLPPLSPEHFARVCAAFGQLESELDASKRDFVVGSVSSVMRIGNVRDTSSRLISMHSAAAPLPADGNPRYDPRTCTPVWHTDSVYRRSPPIGSALYCRIAPPDGGSTCFSDAATALAEMPAEVQAKLEGLECLASLSHHDAKVRARGSPEYPLPSPWQRRLNPPCRVRCVLRHPLSGRKALYGVNSGTFAVVPCGAPMPTGQQLDAHELDGREDDSVSAELRAWLPHCTDAQYVVTWRWRPGDIAVWDNRCTMHAATGFDHRRHTREMWRVTLAEDVR